MILALRFPLLIVLNINGLLLKINADCVLCEV